MWLSPWLVICLCQWSALACADDCDEGFVDDSEEEPKGCRLACGGVPVCHGKIFLCFP